MVKAKVVTDQEKELARLKRKFDLANILKKMKQYDSENLSNKFLREVQAVSKKLDHHHHTSDIHYNSTGEQIIIDDQRAWLISLINTP